MTDSSLLVVVLYTSVCGGLQYEVPKSTWTPPAQEWTPPNIKWTPPRQDWCPPESPPVQFVDASDVPLAGDDVAAPGDGEQARDAMTTLLEMGFADRALNERLLRQHDDSVEAVVQELLALADNDWAANRH